MNNIYDYYADPDTFYEDNKPKPKDNNFTDLNKKLELFMVMQKPIDVEVNSDIDSILKCDEVLSRDIIKPNEFKQSAGFSKGIRHYKDLFYQYIMNDWVIAISEKQSPVFYSSKTHYLFDICISDDWYRMFPNFPLINSLKIIRFHGNSRIEIQFLNTVVVNKQIWHIHIYRFDKTTTQKGFSVNRKFHLDYAKKQYLYTNIQDKLDSWNLTKMFNDHRFSFFRLHNV